MTSAGNDIISTIDTAIGCQQCGRPLGDSPSDDFCSSECQMAWLAARTEALSVYDEPDDLPVHAHNLVELHSPETCVACSERRRRRQIISDAFVAQMQAAVLAQREAASSRETELELRQRNPLARTEFASIDQDATRVANAWYGRFPQRYVLGVDPGGDVIGQQGQVVGHVVARAHAERFQGVLQSTVRQLARDAEMPEDWVERHLNITLAGWQVEILRGQYGGWTDVLRRQTEQMARPATSLAPIMEQMGRAAADAVAALRPHAESLAPLKPPADARERALWLRRNRNTGPATPARAPRAINPRGRR